MHGKYLYNMKKIFLGLAAALMLTACNENYTDASPLAYYRRGNAAQRLIHPDTAKLIEMLLVMLAEEGEDYTFAYIRHILHR